MHELQCKERSQWYVADTISLDGLGQEPKNEITKNEVLRPRKKQKNGMHISCFSNHLIRR